MKNHSGLFALILLGSTSLNQAHAALITNGSFDNVGSVFVDNTGFGSDDVQSPGATAIPGWSPVPGFANDFWTSPSNNYGLTASLGNASGYFVDLTGQANNKPYGGIEQTIATTVGATYSISFDLGAATTYNGAGLGAAALTASATGAKLDGSQEFTLVPTSVNQWASQSLSFVADSTSTVIEFLADSAYTSRYTGLDNVAVNLVTATPTPAPTATPEPASMIVLSTALLGLSFRRRKSV